MSSIPPNIAAGIFQAQIAAGETAKGQDAQRAKRARDSRELARLADQQEHEVEDTEQTENVVVHRPGDDSRDGQPKGDTFERHEPESDDEPQLSEQAGSGDSPTAGQPGDAADKKPKDSPKDDSHIDLSA